MDEFDNGTPQDGLDLEEILKEFGRMPPPEDGEEEEFVRIWDGTVPEPAPEAQSGDTVRLDAVVRAVREQEELDGDDDGTIRFTLPGQGDDGADPEPVPVVYTPPEDVTEPFSEGWEPEYEDPISDYIPPEPIVFRPKNRLRELKKKLVEGPERRYYELEEMGLGKLHAAVFLSALVSVAAVGAVALYELGMVSPDRMRLLVFSQALMLLMSALLGSYQLLGGLGSLLRRRFTPDTLLVFSFLACCLDAVLALRQLRLPCCAAFCVHMTMSLWSAGQKRSTEMSQMDTMRKAIRLNSLVLTPDYYEGRPGYLKGEGQVEDFMDQYDLPSTPEKVISGYALAALFLALAGGIAAGVLQGMTQGLQVFTVALLVALPVSTHVAFSRPMMLLQRRLSRHGSVICGWQGVAGLSRPAAFPLTDTDIFPVGSTKLNGVKFYGSRTPDEVVSCAAALICADGGTIAPLMQQLLDSRGGRHYDVTELRSYPGGIGGIIHNEPVLAGTPAFMQSMGVEMPKGTKVNQAVYVSIDGELAGVFAVTYGRMKSAALGLTTLCAYRRLTPVMTTGDFMLTDGFLRAKFGINSRRIAFPDRAARAALAARQADPDTVALSMTTDEGLASLAYTVTGARAYHASAIAGTVVHLLGGILGLAIVGALVAVGAEHLLTSANILLYHLVWLVPGLLITEWTRAV
ncbi:MAG: hypothetical protein E7436_04305 [Ruminococcaceae bacterium]|nr:hypothetical protein [Oscillospiraceae bacterium]